MAAILPTNQSRTPISPLSATPITADQFHLDPHQDQYELVNGRLVERPMGVESDWIGMELAGILWAFVRQHRLGYVLGPQSGFRLTGPGGDSVRKPDVSFVRFGRFPNETLPRAWAEIAPDLAIEVVSPGDLAEELDAKVQQYLRNGVRLVWVVWPDSQSIVVHRPTELPHRLSADDQLDGEDVLPEFRYQVAELFRPQRPPLDPSR